MQTLLLDSHYQPLGIIDWQKAIVLILQEKAEIVKESDVFVRSVALRMNVPRVLRLLKRSYQKYKASFSRRSVYLRDKGTCAYCGVQMTFKSCTIDHVIPSSKGGTNTWLNVVTACKACNNVKGSRSLSEAKMSLIFKPRVPHRMELIRQLINESSFEKFFKEVMEG